MKLIASLFSLPLILSSCGTRSIEDKAIAPFIDARRGVRKEVTEEDPFDIIKSNNSITYVYLIADKAGKLIYLGENKGYDTSSITHKSSTDEGTWINMKNPRTNESRPVYVNQNVVVSSCRLDM